MEITGTVQREAWLDKVIPPVERLAEDLWSVPVTFPNNPMRYTLAYIIVDGDACLVVDPGFDSPQGRLDLQVGLKSAGVGVRDITGILATHFHTDHLGMASWLRQASGAGVILGRAERRYISAFEDPGRESAADCARMRTWGVPEDRIHEAALDVDGLMHLKMLADADLRVGDGDFVPGTGKKITVVETPGHTPGHICLKYDNRRVVMSGDHVLPRISPNVSLEMRGDPDPLRSCLESLDRFEGDNELEVLPAHEYRFKGLAQRVQELRSLALARSDEVAALIQAQRQPSVWSIAKRLRWSRGFESLGGLQLRLALSETAAHLQYLRTTGNSHGVEGLPLISPRPSASQI
ncbi:glyoxylase-like metal-dependent hydrolase (beta-lactamase superfamily II) [Paenarthrobacter nicotinovorans]|uniref:MBL fold metallo-hydrolase n=1 Tax=Micrococcaceae TaxID=1268 RepID=UPI0008767793|nr:MULTISPECIES: MBL fold metallo-hydrolase [Micrococcaceae]MDR6438711.1 glyoxylase-like metal-dependent hydrolase (beta-lactamase superfamily II) [Paenarthrobacter nicotinovorans]SCZ56496.1 Glyoxylase, beta-lactamase superfamily II [Arthrobacter sp. UNCCL28]